ncbi:hypothetical protein RQM59_13510 [Flavobacteriaceae bacterium S356]|uniref:Adhesin domain-containing protein n=1 Tax=Asprobacillus argus TaxID=3076534 RepID=A0ABU3LII1_9FLAO|nr:hypothetical protein [Flavobacteriaceae bacterium S356]
MKFLKLITIIMLACAVTVSAQRYQKDKKLKSTETIRKELKFETNSAENILVVDNVYGSIDVVGYNGSTVQVEVIKTIQADEQKDLALGKEEIGIKSAKKDNAIYVYLDSPYSHFNLKTGSFDHREFSYNYRRNYKHRSKRMYKYRLDFKIKIPKNTSIDVKAVNNGNIMVENVHGKLLIVRNINGAIDLKNVSGKTDVDAINKDINISYANNPTEESWYSSINGDINIKFKDGLDATISYKTMNGGFYTNFDVEKAVPKINKLKERRNKGTKYKVNSNRHFKIGKGSVHLHFNQLNGDAIVKK